MVLIDRKALLNWLGNKKIQLLLHNGIYAELNLLSNIINRVEAMQTVDAEPVRHGKWIFNKEKRTWECSECHCPTDSIFDKSKTNYCPDCGAKMGVQ